MQPSGSRIRRLTVPIRVMAQRFALLLLVSASVLLMVLARFEYAPLDETQAVITDIFSPLLEAVSHPITAFNKTVTSLVSITNLYDENVFLKQENERLRNWQAQARLLNQENVALRGLLKAQPGPGITYVSGKIIEKCWAVLKYLWNSPLHTFF